MEKGHRHKGRLSGALVQGVAQMGIWSHMLDWARAGGHVLKCGPIPEPMRMSRDWRVYVTRPRLIERTAASFRFRTAAPTRTVPVSSRAPYLMFPFSRPDPFSDRQTHVCLSVSDSLHYDTDSLRSVITRA